MEFYKITAENVRGFGELANSLQEKRIELIVAGRDPVFNSMYTLVLHCDLKTAESVQQMVWECNYGAYCTLEEITGDEVDELC